MKFEATSLAGLVVVHPEPFQDARGRFERLFCDRELAQLHPGLLAAQANLSLTRGRGSVRGLHYQAPPALEWKLVRCLRGRVFDVAVDLRAGSDTFLRWHGVELSEQNGLALFIPEGFAHGFQVLDDEAQLLYFHGTHWNRDAEAGLRHDDPALGIRWPLPVSGLSDRDRNLSMITEAFRGLA